LQNFNIIRLAPCIKNDKKRREKRKTGKESKSNFTRGERQGSLGQFKKHLSKKVRGKRGRAKKTQMNGQRGPKRERPEVGGHLGAI